MIDLNDVDALREVDTGGMLRLIGQFPHQLRKGWEGAQQVALPARYRQVECILVAGMGGSAIGADLLRSIVAYQCRLPIEVSRDYDLPAWVDERTLVIASSYSGNTEETLQSFAAARARRAAVVALTTGGRLADEARQYDIPLLTFHYASPPRAALGYSFVSLLALLARLDLIADPLADLHETIALLETLVQRWYKEVPEADNPTKALARKLVGQLPIIFGTAPFNTVARRWKCQFNENAKTWAAWDELPEADHNTVVGIDFPSGTLGRVMPIFLASNREDGHSAVRRQVTAEVFSEVGIDCVHVVAEGESQMAQVFSLVLYGDYLTCYLALLQGTDPTPIAAIDRLKARLDELGGG